MAKFIKKALTELDLIGPGDPGILDDIYLKAAKEYEKFLMECLEEYGFTKKWLHNPNHKHYIELTRYHNCANAFFIDRVSVCKQDIFSIALVCKDNRMGYSLIRHQNPTEVKIMFRFLIEEEAANESD